MLVSLLVQDAPPSPEARPAGVKASLWRRQMRTNVIDPALERRFGDGHKKAD
jgi:hypothetical protein